MALCPKWVHSTATDTKRDCSRAEVVMRNVQDYGLNNRQREILMKELEKHIQKADDGDLVARLWCLHDQGLWDECMKLCIVEHPRLLCCSVADLTARLNWFKTEVGLSEAQLAKVVLDAPQAFSYASIEDDLEPMKAAFERAEFSRRNIKDLIAGNPWFLGYHVEAKLAFLRYRFVVELGIPEEDVRQMVLTEPLCLLGSKRLMQILAFLEGFKLEPEVAGEIAVANPRIFGQYLDQVLRRRAQYLKVELEMEPRHIGTALRKWPFLLDLPIKEVIEPRVRYLKSLKYSPSEIGALVVADPQVLSNPSAQNFESLVDFFYNDLEMENEYVRAMIRRAPRLLGLSVKDDVIPKIQFFRSMGLSDRGIRRLVSQAPSVLALSLDRNIRRRLAFLQHEVGKDVREVVGCPEFFTVSFERKVLPRVEFLKEAVPEKRPQDLELVDMFMISDERFSEAVAGRPLEEFEAFCLERKDRWQVHDWDSSRRFSDKPNPGLWAPADATRKPVRQHAQTSLRKDTAYYCDSVDEY
eukprot:evm.model.scf_60.19 EVM.evm.TU.scf_60.19   scf_60:141902-143783(-)